MKKILKIASILVIMLTIQFSMNFVYAAEDSLEGTGEGRSSDGTWSDMFSQAEDFLNKGKSGSATIDESEVNDASSSIFNLLLGIGTALAVIIGGILGIQFMIASAEDKAKIKEAFIPYILGCVVIFGAFAIWKIVVNILQSIAV